MNVWAREFYASSKFLHGFELERFVNLWTGFLESGTGVIFVAIHGEEIVGAIGGIAHQDLYNGRMLASEMFWRVNDGERGEGVRLYRAFERWAEEHGCQRIIMAYLHDVMPEKVARFYERLGFVAVETHYSKTLSAMAEVA